MKKKNLIILLLIPFVISLLSIVTINATFQTFNSDISSIEWSYNEVEAFKAEGRHRLYATGVTTSTVPLAPGNGLVWTVENKDKNIKEPLAEIVQDGENWYLVPKSNGEVIVTCSNEKGNIFRRMTVVLYTDGAIVIQPMVSGSQNNIDSTIYYGEYDYDLETKTRVNAKVDFEIRCYPNNIIDTLEVVDETNNITVTLGTTLEVDINRVYGNEDASFTIKSSVYDNVLPVTYNFEIVNDGINVYNYEQLLYCTNRSTNGEIVVLRKTFETEDFVETSVANNVEVFGTYKNNKFNFENEVYKFETTYNTEYIKQWNKFAKESNGKYKEVSTTRVAGLRIQKDFYGNGFTINMHELTYPSQLLPVTIDGKQYYVPTLGLDDLFRGPLPFYTLGDPNGLPLVTAYGQDNVGFYIDGDNITINDVNIRNCDIGSSLSFLDTTGTVVEVNGDNVVIKNSRLSNGKNVLRSNSSMNLLIDNSLLSNSMNFLITTGSNEYLPVDDVQTFKFTNLDGTYTTSQIDEYLGSAGAPGDTILGSFVMGEYTDKEKMETSLKGIQNGLNSQSKYTQPYVKGSMIVNDTYFYNSGLAAICLETLFNGPFLYSAAPSTITELFSLAGSMLGSAVVPYTPTNISGVSYPVTVEISGNTRFYDYKIANNIDLSGLIDENISTIVSDVADEEYQITIDDIFPLKSILVQNAKNENCIYKYEGQDYINIPIAYYGGGINLSTVTFTSDEVNQRANTLEIDFLDRYLNQEYGTGIMGTLQSVMLKSVTVVTGFEPFKFVCIEADGYLFNETPNVSDLITNAKGE